MTVLPDSPLPTARRPMLSRWPVFVLTALALLALAYLLAWVSTSFSNLEGWGSFLVVLVLCLALAGATWWALKAEGLPRKLAALALLAILLRLLAGGLWLTLLPKLGHGTLPERAGYVMADAAARDQAAWRLARSHNSLWTAFEGNRKVDQYGGMLFLSALVYRHLGADFPQPLLVVVITATVSSLALLFTWAMGRRIWDETVAWLAAWILCLYPEAILLGSSQMREAFMLTMVSAAFYGLVRSQQPGGRAGLAWIAGALVLMLPFSPPFAALLLGMLIIVAVLTSSFLTGQQGQRRLWIILGLLAILALAGLWLALKQFAPPRMWNPLEMLSWWFRKSAQYQGYLSQHASGWTQKLFKSTPEWTHLPLLLIYGIAQPFLPAALGSASHATIWQLIAIWRAAGWTLMAAMLVYATLLAWRRPAHSLLTGANRRFTQGLLVVNWLAILVAAFRGGSDLWDNPRYRAVFAGLQAALVAWAWIEHRRSGDAWLRRAFLCAAAILLWFMPWYLFRYYGLNWPVKDPFQTLALGLISAALLCLIDWASTKRKSRRTL